MATMRAPLVLSPRASGTPLVETEKPKRPSARIPALDGWRGVAVLMVLSTHLLDAFPKASTKAWEHAGQHGVTLFFVLSGFLITGTLMKNSNLRTFYVRRFFRLMPVAWTYLATMEVLGVCHWRDTLSCLLFFRNYYPIPASMTLHFWSLSVEEQFYLFWPFIFVLAGTRRARWIAILGALICAFYRVMEWRWYDRFFWNFHTEVRIDSLFVGCLLALVFPQVKDACSRLVIPSLLLLAFCLYRFHGLPPLCECIAMAVLVGATAATPNLALSRMLAARPLVWLGTISYSIYVWQFYFCIPRKPEVTLALIAVMPIFAIGSYYLIERPCNRFGHKLAPSITK